MTKYICPHCKNPIYDDDALSCLYCGVSLQRAVGFLGGMKYLKPKIIILTLVFAVLLSFILLIIL